MNFVRAIGVLSVAAAVVSSLVGVTTVPVAAPATEPTSAFIVELAPGETALDVSSEVAEDLNTDIQIDETFDTLLDGFSAELTPREVEALQASPDVLAVYPDLPMSINATQTNAPWNLSRLDQDTAPADTTYTYPDSAGSGARIYVVDTGVSANPAQFGLRLLPGFDAISGGNGRTDCNGHGTHVAGTAASTTYGVAKQASIVPVRVFGCSGSALTASVIAGLDWIAANHPAGTPGIVNLSLGSDSPIASNTTDPLTTAVNGMSDRGFVMVVAAGNSNANACNYSPSRSAQALTVAATTSTDARASYSNFGACIDLFAPGSSIRSLQWDNPSGSAVMSGTSMAAPIVSGLAALYWSERVSASASSISSALLVSGLLGVVLSPGANTTPLLASSSGASTVSAPSSFGASENVFGRLSLSWAAPTETIGSSVLDYRLEFQSSGGGWILVHDGVTSVTGYTFTSPSPGVDFTFRVRAITSNGWGAPANLQLRTATATPSAPQNFAVTTNESTLLSLAWGPATAPAAAPLGGYELAYSFPGATGWFPISISPGATSYAFSTPSAGYTFTFRLRGLNAWGMGPAQYTTVTTPLSTATEPIAFQVTQNELGRLAFGWQPPARAGASPVVDYELSYTYPGLPFWITVPDGVSPSLSHTIVDPSTGYTFTFRLRARTAQGLGAATFTAVTTAWTPATHPGEPTGLQASENTSQRLTLDWSEPMRTGSSAVTGYVIKYTFPGYPGFVTLPELPSSQTEFTFLYPSGGYFFTFLVYPKNSSGLGDVATVDVMTPSAAPAQPNQLRATRNEPGNLTLEWAPPTSAGATPLTDYVLSYTYPGLPYWITVADGVNTATRYTFTAPSADMTFTFRLQAESAVGLGAAEFYAIRTAG